jgi:F-type H+-transporting ATPase subunit gamma
MAGSTREVRRRVRSVKNIRQITRAMELVAAAKMQRAVQAVQQSRRYASLSWEMLQQVTSKLEGRANPLLITRPRHRLLLILVTSNRGLAGGFNGKVCEAARQFLQQQKESHSDLQIDTVSVGRKGRDYLNKFGFNIVADFVVSDRANAADEIAPLATMVVQDYKLEKYDAVAIAYTDFISMLRQEAVVREILPINQTAGSNHVVGQAQESESDAAVLETGEYLFEPDPLTVLETLVPRLVEIQVYQAVLESRASEQAARMLAMRNATEAAGDLIDDLTLAYNQLRQSGITQELSEISAGRLALGL